MLAKLKQRLFGGSAASKSVAKSRLHFVLVQDRTGLDTTEMADFKKEMVAVIQKYFEIDEEGFDISYKRSNDSTTLLINSPVLVRRSKTLGSQMSDRREKKRLAAEAAAAEPAVSQG